MSSQSDNAVPDVQEQLLATIDALGQLPSPTPSRAVSPDTLNTNRDYLTAIEELLIQNGLVKPLTIRQELDNVGLHLKSVDAAPEPLDPDLLDSAQSVSATLRSVVRKRRAPADSDEDLADQVATVFAAAQAEAAKIATPTPSQPRPADAMQQGRQAFNHLRQECVRKQLIPPRAKPKKQVRSPCMQMPSSADHGPSGGISFQTPPLLRLLHPWSKNQTKETKMRPPSTRATLIGCTT